MDCHAKWPDTRGQGGCLGGVGGELRREGGGNCRRLGGMRRADLDRQGGGQTDESGTLPSQFIPYY